MAHTFSTQVLVDGPSRVVIKYIAISDGATGELSNAVAFDSSAYINDTQDNALTRVVFCTKGCSATLNWDATANVPLLIFPDDDRGDFDFSSGSFEFSQIYNNSGAGRTGDILVTTNGFTTANDAVEFIFYIKKKSIPIVR